MSLNSLSRPLANILCQLPTYSREACLHQKKHRNRTVALQIRQQFSAFSTPQQYRMSSLLFDTGDVRCGSCTPPPSSQQSHSCYLGSHVGTHMGTHMGTQVRVPPFVPRPHRVASAGETLLPPVVGGTLASQPRALSTASANFSAPPPVSTVTCNAHEVCHYFQQVKPISLCGQLRLWSRGSF